MILIYLTSKLAFQLGSSKSRSPISNWQFAGLKPSCHKTLVVPFLLNNFPLDSSVRTILSQISKLKLYVIPKPDLKKFRARVSNLIGSNTKRQHQAGQYLCTCVPGTLYLPYEERAAQLANDGRWKARAPTAARVLGQCSVRLFIVWTPLYENHETSSTKWATRYS